MKRVIKNKNLIPTDEEKEELEKIYSMLTSEDVESKSLAKSLFTSSHYFIRNYEESFTCCIPLSDIKGFRIKLKNLNDYSIGSFLEVILKEDILFVIPFTDFTPECYFEIS